MPMTKQERNALKCKLVALKAAEEVEAVLGLLRTSPIDNDDAVRFTRDDIWHQVNSRSAPNSAAWKWFAGDLEEILEAYAERLLKMAQGTEQDAEQGTEQGTEQKEGKGGQQ